MKTARPTARLTRSVAHEQLMWQLTVHGIRGWVAEHRFHESRRWRFDLAFVDAKVAVEVDGGGFVAGRHGRGLGMEADAEKYSHAAIAGWVVVRVTPRQVRSGQAVQWIRQALEARQEVVS